MIVRKNIHNKIMYIMLAVLYISILISVLYVPSYAQNYGNDINDVVVGKNKRGPYTLTYNNINPESIIVTVNGKTLRKSTDYSIDISKGIISFDQTLLDETLARVSYSLLPGKSQKNLLSMNVPVTFNLFNKKNSSLKISGLYAQEDSTNPDNGKTIIGIGSTNNWSGTSISTEFYMSQKNSDSTPDNYSTLDRAMYKINGGTDIGQLKVTGSFINAGQDFMGSKEYQVAKGKRISDITAAISPDKLIAFSTRFREIADINTSANGSKTQIIDNNIAITPNDATKVLVARSLAETKTDTANSDKATETTSIKIDQKMGVIGSATATVETVNSTAAGKNVDTQETRTIGFNGGQGAVAVRGNMIQKDSQSGGSEEVVNVGATYQPGQQLNVDINYGTLQNQTIGLKTTQNLKVVFNPADKLAVSANVTETNTINDGQISQQSARDFSLSAKPTTYSKLTALFQQRINNNMDDVTKGARMEVTPFFNTTLSAGYIYKESGSTVTTITDYSAASKPFNLVSVSGNMKTRDVNIGESLDSQGVKVAIMPSKTVTVESDYQYNPETDKGEVQRYKAASVGMRVLVGNVGITTNLAQKDEYRLSRLSEERKLGFDLPAFGNGKLTTAVKFSRLLDNSDNVSRTYQFGYQKYVGSNFSLLLSSSYTQYFQNQEYLREKNELKAEASLSMGF